MMKKVSLFWGLILAFSMSIPFLSQTAYADSQTAGDAGVDFTVQPIFERHQKDKNLGYWWLEVKPSETIKLELSLTNNSSKDNTYDLTSNQAVTNSNFVVDYGQTASEAKKYLGKESNATFDFYKDVLFGEKTSAGQLSIHLKAHESVEIPITLKVPSNEVNGQLVGGINVTRVPQESERKNGMLNVYNRAIALVLESGKQKAKQPLEITAGKMTLEQEQINLKNPTHQLLQNVKLTASLKDSSGKIYANFENSPSAVVPNADIAVDLYSKEILQKGKTYHLSIEADYQKDKISKTVANYDVKVDKSGKISVVKSNGTGNALGNFMLWGGIVLVLVVLGLFGFRFWKKAKKE